LYKQNAWIGATLSMLPGNSYLDEWGKNPELIMTEKLNRRL